MKMSAYRGRPEVAGARSERRYWPGTVVGQLSSRFPCRTEM